MNYYPGSPNQLTFLLIQHFAFVVSSPLTNYWEVEDTHMIPGRGGSYEVYMATNKEIQHESERGLIVDYWNST